MIHKEHTLGVGNLAPSTSDSDLKDAFEKFGHLVTARVFKNVWTGKCTGYGFVVFNNQSAMRAAFQEMDDTELGGELITLSKVRPGFGRPQEVLTEGVYRVRFFGVGGGGFGEDCYRCGKPGHLAQECGRVDSVKPRYLMDESRTGERHGSSERRDRSRGDGGSHRGSTYTRHRPGPVTGERHCSSEKRDRSKGDGGSRRGSTYTHHRPGPYDRRG
ncbi:hypothetical protein OROGR_008077 [Orobanche gracilis]